MQTLCSYDFLRYKSYLFVGHGFKTAPVLGKLLAELSMNKTPSYNMESFTINRFKNIYSSKL